MNFLRILEQSFWNSWRKPVTWGDLITATVMMIILMSLS